MATEQSMTLVAAAYHHAVTDTVVGLNDLTGIDDEEMNRADVMILYVHSGNIRRRLDGTVPDTSTGIPTYAGGKEYFRGNDILQAWQMCRDGAVSAVVSVELYGWV